MSILESLKKSSEDGVDIAKKYIETSYKYNKLKSFQILAYSLSTIIKLIFIGSLISAGMIFISLASAIALGNYLDNMSLGYLFVGLFLILIGFIIYLLRKVIEKKVITKMSQQFFDSNK